MRIILNLIIYISLTKSLIYGESKNYQLDENLSSAVVFMYHRFGDDRYPSTNIHLKQFEQHLEYIQKNDLYSLATLKSDHLYFRK